MNRRLRGAVAALVAGGTLATGVLAGTTPADAAGACSARTTVPSRVTIAMPTLQVRAPLTTNCTDYLITATFDAPDHTVQQTLIWNTGSPAETVIFDAGYSMPGVYTIDAANSSAGNGTVTWTRSVSTFKWATWDYIASSRAGRAVYINGLVKNYSLRGVIAGAGRPLYLQRYVHGSWQTMLSRSADSTGRMVVGFLQDAAYQYRLVTPEVAHAWSGTSLGTVR